MSRRTLSFVLLLSLGINLGVLAAVAAGRFAARHEAPPAEATGPPPETGGPVPGDLVLDGPGTIEPGGGADAPDRLPPLGRLADRLGLEGETRERFVTIQRQSFETLLATHREHRRLALALHGELVAANPDRAEIDRLVSALGTTAAEGERAIADAILDTRELLDPEQQRQYLRFVVHLHATMAGGPGPRRGGPGHRRPFPR